MHCSSKASQQELMSKLKAHKKEVANRALEAYKAAIASGNYDVMRSKTPSPVL